MHLDNYKLTSKHNKKIGSLCFWSWNGLLDEHEITSQIRDFSAGKYTGVIIHSRAGLAIPYLGEQWFKCFKVALLEAERLGLSVWIYDEDGWPSGFAGGKVPSLGEEHCYKKLEVTNGSNLPLAKHFIAAFRKKIYSEINVSNVYDGSLAMQMYPSEKAAKLNIPEAISWVQIPYEQIEKDDVVFSYSVDTHYVDLLNKETVKEFIKSTHEVYKAHFGSYFGNVIKGVFTDEPQINLNFPWSFKLASEFEKEYGYSLIDNLILLIKDETDYLRFREDFWTLINKMMFNSFTGQIAKWCDENNLLFTGHFSHEDGLCEQVSANGGVMKHYTAMQLPGIDHLGNRNTSPVLMKQLSSIANQFDKKETLSETFGCSGWGVTFSDLSWIWGRQSALGVTVPCFHLAAYTIEGRRKRDYPAFFSYQEPWWQQFSSLTERIDNLNQFMFEGSRIVDILVISPIKSVMAEFSQNNPSMKKYSSQFRILTENLLESQLDFEIADDAVMKDFAKIEGNEFVIGQSRYTTVFVSESLNLTQTAYNLLVEFSKNGGNVVFVGDYPKYVNLLKTDIKNSIKSVVLQNRKELFLKWASFSGFQRSVTLMDYKNQVISKDVLIHVRDNNSNLHIHCWTNNQANDSNVLIINGLYSVSQIDLNSMKATLLKTDYKNNKTYVEFDFVPKSNYIFEANALTQEVNTHFKKREFLSAYSIRDIEVNILDKNSLTIDKAEVKYKNIRSGILPTVKIPNWIYKKVASEINSETTKIEVEYLFNVSDAARENLTVAFEDRLVLEAKINGEKISKKLGWWIDKCIGEYDISSLVNCGENRIVLTYNLELNHNKTNVSEVFETERNRFFYPVEPDSIYIRGNFDVVPKSSYADMLNYYTLKDEGFNLVKKNEKTKGDLTSQGLWFYRGNAAYKFNISKTEKDVRKILKVSNFKGTLIECKINGSLLSNKIMSPQDEKIDITDYLQKEFNEVEIILYGNNRNLLGPHHHINGENIFVGPSTFEGIKGFEDFVSPGIIDNNTWTDNYAFIKFGCEEFLIEEFKEKAEDSRTISSG